MPEPVFYIRGPLQGPGDERRLFASEGFTEDARAILQLNEKDLKTIAEGIAELPGFVNRDGLNRFILTIVNNKEICSDLTGFIYNLDRMYRDSDLLLEEFLHKIGQMILDQTKRRRQTLNVSDLDSVLSEEEAQKVVERLPQIIKGQAPLQRQWKAEQVVQAVGLPLEEVEIICDLRPVFDEPRSVVEGVVPTTTMKVVVTDVSGLPVSLEARLTSTQVEELLEKVLRAKNKLESLNKFLQGKDIPSPPQERIGEGK